MVYLGVFQPVLGVPQERQLDGVGSFHVSFPASLAPATKKHEQCEGGEVGGLRSWLPGGKAKRHCRGLGPSPLPQAGSGADQMGIVGMGQEMGNRWKGIPV